MSDVCTHVCVESYFYNSMVCEGHKTKLKFIQGKFPTRSFYLFKRDELEDWSHCLPRENKAICSYCDEYDCYTCNRFMFIKKELHTVGYIVARDSKYQPITWEIHKIFLLKKTPCSFNVIIDWTVRYDFLIKKVDFVSCKIIDNQVPKNEKLNKVQKSLLSKMFVRFY